MALTTSIQGYWKTDESSGSAADSTPNANTLTNVGVVYASGKINNGGDFEASDLTDVLTILDASQTGLDITSDIAVSAWLKPESDPVNNGNEFTVVAKFDATGTQRSYIFKYGQQSGNLLIGMNVSSDGSSSPQGTINVDLGTGTFKHVVWSWKASTSTLTGYVNGSSIGTATTGTVTSIFNGTSPFNIGNSPAGAFDGLIDEVGIWSRELTAGEVTTLYNAGAGIQYPFTTGPTSVKTWNAVATASIVTFDALAIGSVKSINGIT